MIKLLSFFVFLFAFLGTWFLFNSRNSIGIDVHAGIQSKLSIMIEDTIKKNKPRSSNFRLVRIFTEKIDDNKLNAKFTFKYDDQMDDNETTSQTMNGEAILSRGLSEDPQIQKWIVQSVKTDSASLEFKEGLVISSDGNSTVRSEAPVEEKKTE
ncbi:MAG: hypothetical protein H7061_02990 [Bdellovibrionaceae bacterium]|nr:hypothetical protein [Bdellovibrio sp.]